MELNLCTLVYKSHLETGCADDVYVRDLRSRGENPTGPWGPHSLQTS